MLLEKIDRLIKKKLKAITSEELQVFACNLNNLDDGSEKPAEGALDTYEEWTLKKMMEEKLRKQLIEEALNALD